EIARGRLYHLDAPARAPGDFLAVARKHRQRAAADRAEPQQTDANRLRGDVARRKIGRRAVHALLRLASTSTRSRRKSSRSERIAWRVRCSFSMSEKRTYSSPYSPKPMPGETATLASASSFFENSSEPR